MSAAPTASVPGVMNPAGASMGAPMGAPMNSTMSLAGGGRRRRGRRSTRRKSMRGGQMSTQSVPMMKAGSRSRHSRRKQQGGQMSTQSVPMKASMMGGAKPAVGSKAQVWHGSARHTSGGLTKKDLMKHKGRIISKRKHALGKKALKNLVKAGYKAKKGTFKLFRK